MKRLTVEIDEKLHAESKAKAYAEGMTLKERIEKFLLKWLRE
jgi:hypothetical protein